jgi:hypothetical protein
MLLTTVHWTLILSILSIITNYSVYNSATNGRNNYGSRAEIPVQRNKAKKLLSFESIKPIF